MENPIMENPAMENPRIQTPTQRKARSGQTRRGQRGNTIVELALVTPFLMLLLTGSFTIGMSLNRSMQASNVLRNANVLMSRNVDLSRSENQNMLIRSAAGLGMNVPGTNQPNPSGKGTLILSRVIRVGPVQCAVGIVGWNGNPNTCPNYGQYVIAQRIRLGNTSRWVSSIGNPTSALSSDGSVSDADIASVTSNRANGFPQLPAGTGVIYLANDTFAFIGEMFADLSELSFIPWVTAPEIKMMNIS
jgi:hypothetical protein